MRKIRNLLAGTALAGSLAVGLAAAPAAHASATEATGSAAEATGSAAEATGSAAGATGSAATAQALGSRHFFGPIYSGFGHGEGRGDRSYFKGYWIGSGGRYYFSGSLLDRDHDHQYSYVWFRWHDDHGFHTRFFRTFGRYDLDRFGGFRRSDGFDDFDVRVCEGRSGTSDCGGYTDVF
ncbi:hypothetical protein [Sphaerisporangium fuscum]|uniref:hypothetical protein n=1 Tax=Sphaerisporangium fuscum TaxID=2835868 RepID=UPI001BDC1ED1|nr:hypothetical protein [Sphaerisporangium fuscum]